MAIQNSEKQEIFKKGDVVEVVDTDNIVLGKGQIKMDAEELRIKVKEQHVRNVAGTRTAGGEKIVIHYDYFVFS